MLEISNCLKMNFDEIKSLQADQRDLNLPFEIKRRRVIKGYVVINDYVPIPVENVASFYDRSHDLPIKREDNTEIGYLYFTRGEDVSNRFSLSEPKFVCFLIDIPSRTAFDNNNSQIFKFDYIVIYRQYLSEYLKKYIDCAPIWGCLNHKYSGLQINPPVQKTLTEINLGEFKKFSENYYFEASVRGIKNSCI